MGASLRLVVIDATWRKSLWMLLEHPALAALPRLSLEAPAPTLQALAMLEGPSFDAAPLLDAFGRFVADVAARRRSLASAGQTAPSAPAECR